MRRAGWFLGAAALIAVLAAGNFRVLTGSADPKWDAVDLFEPTFSLVGDAIRSGHLVTWDPWSGAGAPDWTEPEFGTSSPVMLAAGLLPLHPLSGYILYWFGVWAFGAIGMLLLARHAGCSAPGATIVACGFAASGFFTGHAEHMSSIYSVSFLPWILWRFDAGFKYRDRPQNGDSWCGVQAGVLYGLSGLGGYPEFTILTPGFLLLWALGRVLSQAESPEAPAPPGASTLRAATRWITTVAVGALIFSVPYVGLLKYTRGYSDYIGPRPREVALSSNLLPAGALSTFASPYLAELNLQPKPIWPETDISMTSVYTGAATLVLAAFALLGRGARRRWRWWVAALGAFFLCCALGNQLPVRGWLYDLVPPTRYFRNPSLLRAYVILTIAYLGALGARDLTDASATPADRERFAWLAALAACGAAICFDVVTRIAGKSLPGLQAGVAQLCLAWGGLAALSFLLQGRRLRPDRFLALAAALACLDGLGALYLSSVTLREESTPWVQAGTAGHNPALDLTSTGLNRDLVPPELLGQPINNRNLLVKKAVFDNYTSHQILRNRFQQQIKIDPLLSRMATGRDRIWFSATATRRAPDDASFDLFQRRVHEFDGVPILILHSPEQMLALAPAGSPQPGDQGRIAGPVGPPAIPAAISELAYQPNLLAFRYDAPSRGYLLVTDRWAEGWEATVNGQPRPVLGADFIYRAVEVDAGANRVRFVYQPWGFRLLLAISWGTLLVAAAEQCRRWAARRPAP
jgi:hypothetical protein